MEQHRQPLHDQTWFEYGWQCECDGELMEAVAAYRQAIENGPPTAEVHFNLANVLRELRCDDEAMAHYQAAVRIDPAMCGAWYNLADALESRGDHQHVIHCLQNALRADPAYADAHFNLARSYESVRRWSDAARHWAQYLLYDRCSEWALEAQRALMMCRRQAMLG